MHKNTFLAGAKPRTLVGEFMTLPPDSYSCGESCNTHAEARQTCPGFFLKSLNPSWNLLEISWKFA